MTQVTQAFLVVWQKLDSDYTYVLSHMQPNQPLPKTAKKAKFRILPPDRSHGIVNTLSSISSPWLIFENFRTIGEERFGTNTLISKAFLTPSTVL